MRNPDESLKELIQNLLDNDLGQSSEVPSYQTRIILFESNEISIFPKEDKQLINTFWDRSDYSILFIEDSLGNIHASNRISFSGNTNQKINYSRLATEASKAKYFQGGR
jgi:hypothetical protein